MITQRKLGDQFFPELIVFSINIWYISLEFLKIQGACPLPALMRSSETEIEDSVFQYVIINIHIF
jgi:hypothetical protein